MRFTTPNSDGFAEANDCHSPADGKFCSTPGGASATKRVRTNRRIGGSDYELVFPSKLNKMAAGIGRFSLNTELEQELTRDQARKFKTAKVVLAFEPHASGHLGSPVVWTAPNGVQVVYKRGQRRSRGGTGTYHDFRVDSDELVVPLTRNVGSGRRALRAWAAVHLADITTLRFQARQLVRPGD